MTATIEKEIVKDSKGKEYQLFNGTAYHVNTPAEVIVILDRALNQRREYRIRLFYGDTETGRDWLEEYQIIGYVGRSTGSIKIPLLISRRDSTGGPGILDHCIVKITFDKLTVYQHDNYHLPELEIVEADQWLIDKGYNYTVPGHANFKTYDQAEKWIDFIQGNRNTLRRK